MRKATTIKFTNIFILVVSICFAFFIGRMDAFNHFIINLATLGIAGAFLGGMLFTSSFTASISVIILLSLTEFMTNVEISVLGGLGAMIGDYIIFRFVRDGLMTEFEPIYNKMGGKHLTTLLHTKYFAWSLPVMGAAIIASPLPDELGVSLLGVSKISSYNFMVISLIANTIGIFLIVSAFSLL